MSKRSKLFLKGIRRKTKIAYLLVVGVLVALTIRVVYINVAKGVFGGGGSADGLQFHGYSV